MMNVSIFGHLGNQTTVVACVDCWVFFCDYEGLVFFRKDRAGKCKKASACSSPTLREPPNLIQEDDNILFRHCNLIFELIYCIF